MSDRTEHAVTRRALGETRHLRAGRISVSRLRLHPANMSRDPGDLTELAESLRVDGCLQALLVQQRGEMHEVVDGRRRYLAARIAGLRTLPVMWQDQRGDDEVLAATVATDVHKKWMSPEERAAAVRGLRAAGWTVKEIAERFGKTPATIYAWLSAVPEEVAPDRAATPVAPAAAIEEQPPTPAAPPQPPEPVDASARTTARPAAPKASPVWARSVLALADRVEHQAAGGGLTGDKVAGLVRDLRALTGDQR